MNNLNPMTNADAPRPSRSRRACCGCIAGPAGLLLAMILLWGAINFSGWRGTNDRVIRIGPDTTVISEPLKPNGDVDYVAYLNQKLSEGVTPENNAAVLLVQVLGTAGLSDHQKSAYFKALGCENLESQASEFKSLHTYLATIGQPGDDPNGFNLGRLSKERQEEYNKRLRNASDNSEYLAANAWSETDFPDAANWLNISAESLEKIRAAVLRPRFFSPCVESRLIETVGPWYSYNGLGLNFQGRNAAKSLATSAMNHLHNGQIDSCLDDLKSINRLAALLNQRQLSMAFHETLAVRKIAHHCAWQLIASRQLDDSQYQELQGQFSQQHEILVSPKEMIEQEQIYCLNEIQALAEGESDLISRLTPVTPKLLAATIDWEAAGREFNQAVQAQRESVKEPDRQKRWLACKTLRNDFDSQTKDLFSKWSVTSTVLSGRKAKGVFVGRYLARTFVPNLDWIFTAEARSIAQDRMIVTMSGLERFHLANGHYPASLAELIPIYEANVPLDPFTDLPLVYRQTETGFELYSVGENRKDDGGRTDRRFDRPDLKPDLRRLSFREWLEIHE